MNKNPPKTQSPNILGPDSTCMNSSPRVAPRAPLPLGQYHSHLVTPSRPSRQPNLFAPITPQSRITPHHQSGASPRVGAGPVCPGRRFSPGLWPLPHLSQVTRQRDTLLAMCFLMRMARLPIAFGQFDPNLPVELSCSAPQFFRPGIFHLPSVRPLVTCRRCRIFT